MTSQPEQPRRSSSGETQTTRPLPKEPALRVPSPTPQSGAPAWGATLALLAIAIIVAGVAAIFVLELWLADRIVPGVYVWDVDVGGLDRDQAMERLSATFRYPDDRHPALRYDASELDGRWEPSQLPPSQRMRKPRPLFKKLDESIVEEELARMRGEQQKKR